MMCEIKHYEDDELPFGMWVNGEFVGSYKTIAEAVKVYEHIAGMDKVKEESR